MQPVVQVGVARLGREHGGAKDSPVLSDPDSHQTAAALEESRGSGKADVTVKPNTSEIALALDSEIGR